MAALQNPELNLEIEVEFFGVPRVITGVRAVRVSAHTLGEVAAELGRAHPALMGTVIDRESSWLLNGYTFVVDDRFSRNPDTPVDAHVPVLLVSSVAGG